jgi:hypothetical protein
MYGMATSLCRCVTDTSTWTGPNREAGCSSINLFGLKPFVSIAGPPSDLPVTDDRWEGALTWRLAVQQTLAAGYFADG